MANRSIKELPEATKIQEDDALPMQQGTVAKQVTGLTLTLWLLDMADGHGGVTDFQKLSESGLEKTYQFTMADTTKYTFTVTDGNGVADFQHSVIDLVHTYKLIMDNGQEYTMTVKDGEKGDKGDNAYLWYKFASEKPTSSSSSMGDEPDAWMGVHSGHEKTAPTDPKAYTWVRILGNTGPTGAPATLLRSAVEYQVSTSGTVVPSGNWSETIPTVPQGNYLWTRTTIQFNTGGIIQSYTNGRNGLDGLGSVVSVNNVSPGENGNVELTADDVGAVPKSGGTMEGPIHMNGKILDGLNDPQNGDEAVKLAYVIKHFAPLENNAGNHNSIYRGKNLGTSVTPEQWAAIKAGTFADMFIGDYWTINGTKYLIAHFDYRKTLNGSHHIVIVPALTMYTHAMNDTAITTGGYYDSKMKKSGLNQALETVKADFGADHIMTYKIYLTNATENGAASAGSVYDSQIDLMSERMVFGASAFGNGGYNAGNDRGQLALFALDTTASVIGVPYFLRDVASVTCFAAVHFDGYAVNWWAATPSEVRPAFCIYQA